MLMTEEFMDIIIGKKQESDRRAANMKDFSKNKLVVPSEDELIEKAIADALGLLGPSGLARPTLPQLLLKNH